MTLSLKHLVTAAVAVFSLQAHAALNVVACEPEWASLLFSAGGSTTMPV